jgi:predicted transcriptional regulator
VQSLEPDFRGRMSFVHLEIYSDPQTQTTSLAVNEWKLPSEPWAFIVDREGKIADKLEGALTAAELRESIERVV